MKRNICIFFIVIFLFAICTLEQILVHNTLTKLKELSQSLYEIALSSEDVNTQAIFTQTNNLNDFWQKNENYLCFFINHKDMQEMGNELIKMISYSKSNIKEEYLTSLELVRYYCNTFNHIMGLSLQNLI